MQKIARMISIGVILCTLAFATVAMAQNTNSGDIRGTVTDTSGAVVPGVTIKVTNRDTGVTRAYTTNNVGLYDTVSTPPGEYNIVFTKPGFKELTIGPVELRVAVITENAVLQVGAVTQEVSVVSHGAPLLQTETGKQGTVMVASTIDELPQMGAGITGNDWANFNVYLPGAGGTTQGRNSMGRGAWDAGDAVSINGNLPNFDNFLQDGASTILPASYNNDDEIMETIQEVEVNTSSFSAQYGMGGVVFNQISKSGTNQWHGSAYEYLQNDALNAAGYFNNQAPLEMTNPLNPTGPEIPNPAHQVPRLRYNEWGFSVGGPIIHDKLFFYFDRDKIDNNNTGSGFVTLPTAAEERGDFTGMYPIYDPLTTTGSGATLTRTQFANNIIPGTRIDSVSSKIMASKYGWPTAPPGVGTCQPAPYQNECTNNAFLSQPGAAPVSRYFTRIDYNLSEKNRIMWSWSNKDNPNTANGLLPCPEDCGTGDVTGNNTQLTDTWTLSPTMVNEFRFGYTRQGNYFLSSTIGLNPATEFGLQGTHFNQMPFIGNSSIWGGFGGPDAVNPLAPATDAIYIENSFDPSDVVTLIHGKHILKFGVEVLISQGNTTAWGSNSAGNYGFTGQYTAGVSGGSLNTGTSGAGFADFLLGNVEGWSAMNQFKTGMRMKSPQAFIQDDWKVNPNLTINLGLRWTGNTGMSEEHNRLGNFDPTLTAPTGPFASTTGSGSIWFAPNNGRTTLEKPTWDLFLPRAGFAWSLRNNTVVRGGFGLFAYNYSMDLYGGEGGGQMGFGASASGGNGDPNAAAGDTGWIAGTGNSSPLYLSSSAAEMANALPYFPASTDPASYVTNPVRGAPYLPYDTPPGEIYQWTLSVQHQFANNFVASVAYVGSHAKRLQFNTDLNQITDPTKLNSSDVSACNGATPASIAANPSTCARPYPAWGGLGGSNFNAISNYNSLQFDVQKRYSNGLTFDANYAWSHMLDEQDSAGWGSTAGAQVWQVGNDPGRNYGNSNFDIPQALKGTATYELPFGIGRAFMHQNAISDAAFGGWRVAGTFILQSGSPFTVLDGGVNDYSQAGNVFANPVSGTSAKSGTCPNGAAVGTLSCWFNPAAFETPAQQGNGAFGVGGRNTLFGPKLFNIDLSAAKSWHFKERYGFTIRSDFINALNHPSFTLPNNDVSSSAVATINGVSNNSRTIQLGARFSF
jgi:Carboxypeptidase regulatory-like domain